MKKLLLLTFLFTSFLCEAQQKVAVLQWQKTIGGFNEDKLYGVTEMPDGGYILAGHSFSDSTGSKTEKSHGGSDYWLIRLDSLRNIVWQRTIGGLSSEAVRTLKVTNDGGFILGGINGIGGYTDYYVVKVSATGNVEWQKTFDGYAWNKWDNLRSLSIDKDGGYLLSGSTTNSYNQYSDSWLIKLDTAGNMIWQKVYGGSNHDELYATRSTSDGGYILGGYGSGADSVVIGHGGTDYLVIKMDSLRNIKWQKQFGGSGSEYLVDVQETKDKGFIIAGYSNSNASGNKAQNSRGSDDYWIVKTDSIGNVEWERTFGGNSTDQLAAITQTYDNGYLVGGYSSSGISGDKTGYIGSSDYWVLKIDEHGAVEWQRAAGGKSADALTSLSQTKDSSYLLGGYSGSGITGDKTDTSYGGFDYWIFKLKTQNANIISGNVFKTIDNDCTKGASELGIPNIILKTESKIFYGIADSSGKYSILTDTGKYTIKQIVPNYALPLFRNVVCPVGGMYQNISFSEYGKDTTGINFANDITLCPYLQVELAQARMRRCFDNTTAIKYCNIGNVDTTNVQVIVTLPEYVTFVSASNTNYTISGKKITFNIGVLRANECGAINLITKVDCVNGITGLTQCISAYILPRNKCVDQIQPDYALWDKSEVSVDGRCTGNTARFVIKNTGQNNMTDSSSYRIYKDAVQAVNKKFKLIAGDSLVINVTATGNTYRLEADQVAHFPSASLPSVTIENCGTGVASRGFVNQMPQNTLAPDVEKICLPIRDSYDPNDKSVSPSGVGTGKLVKHKVSLDFLVRFQNTGTDTAYKVVIIDTLDQNLDLATLEFGASSHKYKIEFTGSGKPILKFTFDKINLVDSFTNEPKSHGFLSFKITPYDSIPNGTLVKNSADIYFDFNLPIKTNTTQVSIDDRLPTGATLSFVTAVKEQKSNYEAIYVYPNPFNTITNFEFVYNTKATQLIVYNINGELVANENVANKTTYQFHRNNLANGMYFYVVQNNEGETIGRGKIVLQ